MGALVYLLHLIVRVLFKKKKKELGFEISLAEKEQAYSIKNVCLWEPFAEYSALDSSQQRKKKLGGQGTTRQLKYYLKVVRSSQGWHQGQVPAPQRSANLCPSVRGWLSAPT